MRITITCPDCKGKPYGVMKFWPDLLFVCSGCNGKGNIEKDVSIFTWISIKFKEALSR